jgi:hypothetical protein
LNVRIASISHFTKSLAMTSADGSSDDGEHAARLTAAAAMTAMAGILRRDGAVRGKKERMARTGMAAISALHQKSPAKG